MNPSLTAQAHGVLRQVIKAGDIAIDATAGNGHDTLFLAEAAGPAGRVFAFDIQPAAIEATSQRLGQHAAHVDVLQVSHALLLYNLPADCIHRVAAVMFNLGYLPGGDKRLATNRSTTITAIRQGLLVLRPGGLMTIIAYPGHAEGEAETTAVLELCEALAATEYRVEIRRSEVITSESPILVIIEKLVANST